MKIRLGQIFTLEPNTSIRIMEQSTCWDLLTLMTIKPKLLMKWNIDLKSMERWLCFIVEFLSIFGVKTMHDYKGMLVINWSYFLEGIHFSITPIQPKCSANQGRVEFRIYFIVWKLLLHCKCYRCLGKKNEALLETYPWGII